MDFKSLRKTKESKRLEWSTGRVLERFDAFGSKLPPFNLKGKTKVHTRLGGIVSLLIMSVTLMYGSIKFMHLLSRHNPNMS